MKRTWMFLLGAVALAAIPILLFLPQGPMIEAQAQTVSRFGRLDDVRLSTNTTPGYLLTQYTNSSGGRYWSNSPPATAGTVSSVSLTMPSDFAVSGSPVTSSGGFTVTRNTQPANTVQAGPASGSAAAPTYRALVAADIPTTLRDTTLTNLTAKQITFNQAALTYASTVNLDFTAEAYQTVALTGNITFTTSNRGAGKTVTVRITADSSARNFTFPSWHFIGAAAPASIAASKTAVLTVTAFGTLDTDCVAAYAVEP